jgi:replicative DNA helicase
MKGYQALVNKKKNVSLDQNLSLPHDNRLEAAVLGAILLDNNYQDSIWNIVEPKMFLGVKNRIIAKVMCDMYRRNEHIDSLTLSNELKRIDKLEDAGGVYYLTELAESIPSAASSNIHAEKVAELWRKRTFIEKLYYAANSVREGESIEDSLPELDSVLYRKTYESEYNMHESMLGWIEHIDKIRAGGFETKTGLVSVDEYLGGFNDGEFIIIAGRPSVGKSAFAFKIAHHNSVVEQKSGGIISIEMPAPWCAGRLSSIDSQINLHDFSNGNLSEIEWEAVNKSMERVSGSPLYVYDKPNISLSEIRSVCKKWKQEKGIKYVLLDYLQLINCTGDSRADQIEHISRGIKHIAREVEIPFIALSQLSRASEVGVSTPRRPRLSDLRGSGAIEQDADVVMFVHRFPKEATSGEIIIEKQRNGPVGAVEVDFINKCALYIDK